MSGKNTIDDTTQIHEILKSHMTRDEQEKGVQVSQVAKQALGVEDPRVSEIKTDLKKAVKAQIPTLENDSFKEQLSKNSLVDFSHKLQDILEEEFAKEPPEVRKQIVKFVNNLFLDITMDPGDTGW